MLQGGGGHGRLPGHALSGLLLALAGICAFAAALPGSTAGAYTFSDDFQQLGPEETVFNASTQACEGWDIPDAPARAFRDAYGRVQLISSHYTTRRAIGPTLNTVHHDCRVLLSSDASADPSTYDDLRWVVSPFTIDGLKVYSPLHEEYRGFTHAGMCDAYNKANNPQACVLYALTFARSLDAGDTYTAQPAPTDLLAAVPYQYVIGQGPFGIRNPSNIVFAPDGYFYMLASVDQRFTQTYGTCLLRTQTLNQPDSWRAWDGSGFNIRFIDPYTDISEPPTAHTCTPVSPNQIALMSSSLTYNTYLGKYLLLGNEVLVNPTGGAPLQGFYYSTSDDLINWTQLKPLMQGEMPYYYTCGDPAPVLYPSVLDPSSPARNYNVTGQEPYLYYTRFNVTSGRNNTCFFGANRDLVRVPIRLNMPAGTAPPPDCGSVVASPHVLPDPTHNLTRIRLIRTGYTIEVNGVTQDERSQTPDARWETRPDWIDVRADRNPAGDGRVYRIAFTAVGGTGSCKGVVTVLVPTRARTVDSAPPSYDSLSP